MAPPWEAEPSGAALEQVVVQRQDKGVERTGLSTIPVLEDRAKRVFDQQVPVLVMVEESFEVKQDVVERRTGVKRTTGVYFVCLFEQPGQWLQMTRP